MGRLLIHLLLLMIIGCNSQKLEPSSSLLPKAPSSRTDISNLFAKWPKDVGGNIQTPLVVSKQFGQDEKSKINEMAQNWISAANFQYNFFADPLTEVDGNPSTENYNNLDQYNDNEMGIYKADVWFSEVSSFALAITQYFGVRRNAGTSKEYIELRHADIIFNTQNFTFSTEVEAESFDFASVVLHEMGHFLGLPHASYSVSSVMIPTIRLEDIKQIPTNYDEIVINSNYEDESYNAGIFSLQALRANSINEGEQVRGIIELRSNGDCYHYQDNLLIQVH